MPKHGKNYREASEAVEDRAYETAEAVELAKSGAFAKFDEGVDVSIRLAVDPKHADQMVRGTRRAAAWHRQGGACLVFASGEKVKEAEEAGADHVGGAEMAKKVQGGWLDFDAVVSTPDMMKEVGKLGRVLGPRGLMPNPKAGTVTFDVGKAVRTSRRVRSSFGSTRPGFCTRRSVAHRSRRMRLRRTSPRSCRRICAPGRRRQGALRQSVSISSTMGPGIRSTKLALG